MNRKRRELLKSAVDLMNYASNKIETARDQEQDCFDNLPENLKDYDKGIVMEEAIDNLDSALDSLKETIDYVEKAI